MALINCPECGKEVSDKATTCPNCGTPLKKKYCQHCGERIDSECVVCPKCGKQVGRIGGENDNIIINNNVNSSSSSASSAAANATAYNRYRRQRPRNKWTAFFLCLFLGIFGAHKFYDGKAGMGILYLCTCGLFFIGWLIDIFAILGRPNPYYI